MSKINILQICTNYSIVWDYVSVDSEKSKRKHKTQSSNYNKIDLPTVLKEFGKTQFNAVQCMVISFMQITVYIFMLSQCFCDHELLIDLREQFESMAFGIDNYTVTTFKLRYYSQATSNCLKDVLYHQYTDFIESSHQITGIEDGISDTWNMLQTFQKILQYQSNVNFDLSLPISSGTQSQTLSRKMSRRYSKLLSVAMPNSTSQTLDSLNEKLNLQSEQHHASLPIIKKLASASVMDHDDSELITKKINNPFDVLDDIKSLLQARKYYDALTLLNNLCGDIDSWRYDQLINETDMLFALNSSVTFDIDVSNPDLLPNSTQNTSDDITEKFILFGKIFENKQKLTVFDRAVYKIKHRIFHECSKLLKVKYPKKLMNVYFWGLII